jgi:hypothetical protein
MKATKLASQAVPLTAKSFADHFLNESLLQQAIAGLPLCANNSETPAYL